METVIGISLVILILIIALIIYYKEKHSDLTGRWYKQKAGFNRGIYVEFVENGIPHSRKASKIDKFILKYKFKIKTLDEE